MGRKSREKRKRRVDPKYKTWVRASRAETRGRRVHPSTDGYEQAARAFGTDGIIEALISRHNQRWVNIRRNFLLMGDPIAGTLQVLLPLDVFLWRFGVRFTAPPWSCYGSWKEQLRWGLDSACQSSRMVLAGNVTGAAAIARTQLERWSSNRAESPGIEPRSDGISTAEHYTAIWKTERPAIPAGAVWAELSELLHGRGPLVEAAHWEAAELAGSQLSSDGMRPAVVVMTAVQLSLRQILLCIGLTASEKRYPSKYCQGLKLLPLSGPPGVRLADARAIVYPLHYDNLSRFGRSIVRHGDMYLSYVRDLATGPLPKIRPDAPKGLEALSSRRIRAAALAMQSFELEKQQLGHKFKPANLAARNFRYIVIGEMAGLLSLWSEGPESDALAVASSALRAGFWLWLEDDDRSMILARTVVEQTARLRTWRIKKDKAAMIEARGSRASARDWLEAAGWRRLSVLNRSLGEFAHASSDARWSGARQVLAQIQLHDEDQISIPSQTACGNVLDEVAFALGVELSHVLQHCHRILASALEKYMPHVNAAHSEERIEEWLKRCWVHRNDSFGNSDFRSDVDFISDIDGYTEIITLDEQT